MVLKYTGKKYFGIIATNIAHLVQWFLELMIFFCNNDSKPAYIGPVLLKKIYKELFALWILDVISIVRIRGEGLYLINYLFLLYLTLHYCHPHIHPHFLVHLWLYPDPRERLDDSDIPQGMQAMAHTDKQTHTQRDKATSRPKLQRRPLSEKWFTILSTWFR